MNISAPFIRRPIGTSLLAAALLLSGILAFNLLPVASLPRVDFPVISVGATLPGADPQTMASAVATPLERQFGRISGVNQMTSSSQLGSTAIALQFDLNRNIDAAARDVQAAINAARSQLPSNLPSNPTYRKINPADAPILILALTSDTVPVARLYDTSDSILAQKLSQVNGVGQVFTYGSAPPAVRVEVNPMLLNKLGVGLDTVRNALNLANANQAKGQVSNSTTSWVFDDNDQLFTANQYRPLIIAYRNGGPVRLGDVADVQDSVADVHNLGLANGKPGVLVVIFRQPGANIIQTVDRVRALMPYLQSSISPAIKLEVVMDRTVTVRASVKDIETTLLISIVLVILVVFVFLRTVRATMIPEHCRAAFAGGNIRRHVSAGLQPGQSVAHGAGDFHRLRGGRRDRGAGKHHALRRTRHGCGAGGLQRSGGDWVYRAFHEHLAGGGVHSIADDGRNRGAAVPRVRGYAEHGDRSFAAGIADHHADHVRQVPSSRLSRTSGITFSTAAVNGSSTLLAAYRPHPRSGC